MTEKIPYPGQTPLSISYVANSCYVPLLYSMHMFNYVHYGLIKCNSNTSAKVKGLGLKGSVILPRLLKITKKLNFRGRMKHPFMETHEIYFQGISQRGFCDFFKRCQQGFFLEL